MVHSYKEILIENVYKSKQIQGGKLSRLPGWNLISPCIRRVKFVRAEQVQISSGQPGSWNQHPSKKLLINNKQIYGIFV